jgi:hypothetical protein
MLYLVAVGAAALLINAPVAPPALVQPAAAPAIAYRSPTAASIFPTTTITADLLDDFAAEQAVKDAQLEAKVRARGARSRARREL